MGLSRALLLVLGFFRGCHAQESCVEKHEAYNAGNFALLWSGMVYVNKDVCLIHNASGCCLLAAGHAVVLVGYDNDNMAWLALNSWVSEAAPD